MQYFWLLELRTVIVEYIDIRLIIRDFFGYSLYFLISMPCFGMASDKASDQIDTASGYMEVFWLIID